MTLGFLKEKYSRVGERLYFWKDTNGRYDVYKAWRGPQSHDISVEDTPSTLKDQEVTHGEKHVNGFPLASP